MANIFSSRTPQQALASLLEHQRPARLLCVAREPLPALQAYVGAHPHCQLVEASVPIKDPALLAERYDLVIVADCLEHLPLRQGRELLGGLRNLNTSRLAVLVDLAASEWQLTDFYALALQASERFARDGQVVTLFSYDLHDYKQVPDWLNAKFWANPQNFGKYWW
jgi:mitochondrial fission protein ELM1